MTLSPSVTPQASPPEPLAACLRAGDPAALSDAYFEHAATLVTLASRLLANRADAEDVVHDLFVALPEALSGYQEQGKFSGWLKRALIRLALMRLRSARRRREIDLRKESHGLIQSPSMTPDQIDLERALQTLPDDDRTILVLKAIEGFSHEEIAGLLGIRQNTSAVRYHRALQRLRAAMETP